MINLAANKILILFGSLLFPFIYGCTSSGFTVDVPYTLWDSNANIGLKYSGVESAVFSGVTYYLETTSDKSQAIVAIMLSSNHLVDQDDRVK